MKYFLIAFFYFLFLNPLSSQVNKVCDIFKNVEPQKGICDTFQLTVWYEETDENFLDDSSDSVYQKNKKKI